MSFSNEADDSDQYKLLIKSKNWWDSKPRSKQWSDLNIPQKQKVVKAYFNILQHPSWESMINESRNEHIGDPYDKKGCPLAKDGSCNCGDCDTDDGYCKTCRKPKADWYSFDGEAFEEQEHPRDNDGKFATKAGGDKPKDTQKIVATLSDTYHNLKPEFIISQIEKAEKLRNDAKATNESIQHDLKSIKDVTVFGRVKEVESMIGKLGRKPDEYKDVSDLNDVSGVRVMTKNINDVSKTISYIRSKYNVIQEENNIDHDRGGYRSYHVTVQDEHGVKSEIQIRTENQNAWANWCHDNFYKPKNQKLRQFYNEHKEVITNYSLGMSDYYYKKDIGIDTPRPVCPPEIEQVVGCMQ